MKTTPNAFKDFPTFGGESSFDAVFHPDGRISLRYGSINEKSGRRNGYRSLASGYLERMAAYFSWRLVAPSASGENAESVDRWIRDSGIATRLSPYVCALLVERGFAKREGDSLRFL